MNKSIFPLFVLILLIMGIFSCASYRTVAVRTEPVPLGKEFPELKTVSKHVMGEKKEVALSKPTGALSLRGALSLAIKQNPELAVFSYEVRIQEANALQSSLLPNPEFETEVENFAGSGTLNGIDESELTVSIGQLIELGGKRQKRTNVAALGADLAAWEYESAKLNVFTDVVKTFTEVLVVQHRIDLQKQLVKVAEAFLMNIQRRVEAGRISPAEAARAKVELFSTIIELERQQQELLAVRKKLAAMWDSTEPQFERVVGELDTVLSLPSLEKLQSFITRNPNIARWAVEMQQRDAKLALEKSLRIPDPTIGAGYRRLNESGDNAFVMSVSLPLLLFDRNQGNIQAAEYRKLQTELQKRMVEISLTTKLSEIHSMLSAAYNEVIMIKTNVLSEAQNAFDMINQGYQMGKFGFLDVLDAQRTLFEVRSRYLNSLKQYHQSIADLERLIGQKISDFQ